MKSSKQTFSLLASLSLTDSTSASTRLALGYPQRRKNLLSFFNPRCSSSSPSSSSINPISVTRRRYSTSNPTLNASSSSEAGWVANHPLAPRRESGTDMSLHPSGINPDVFEEITEEYHFTSPDQVESSTKEQHESIIQQPLPSASHLLSKTILSSTPPSNSTPVATSLLKDFLELNTSFTDDESKTVYLLAGLRCLRLGLIDDSLLWLAISPHAWREDLEDLEVDHNLSLSIKNNTEETLPQTRNVLGKLESIQQKVKLNHQELFNFILIHCLNSISLSTNLHFLQQVVLIGVRKGYLSSTKKEDPKSNIQLLRKLLVRIFRYGNQVEKQSEERSEKAVEENKLMFWKQIVEQMEISTTERRKHFKKSGLNCLQDRDLSHLFNLIIRTLILSGDTQETLKFLKLSPSLLLDSRIGMAEDEERNRFGFDIHFYTYKILIEELVKVECQSQVKRLKLDLEVKALDLEEGLKRRLALNYATFRGVDLEEEKFKTNQSIASIASLEFIPSFLKVRQMKRKLFESIRPSTSLSSSLASEFGSVTPQVPVDMDLLPLLRNREIYKARELILSRLELFRQEFEDQNLSVIPNQETNSHQKRFKSNFNHLPSTKNLATFLTLVHHESQVKRNWFFIREHRTFFFKNRTFNHQAFLSPLRSSLHQTQGGKHLFETAMLYSKVNHYQLKGSKLKPDLKSFIESISFYHQHFLMGEREGPGGIDEELLSTIGIDIQKAEAERERIEEGVELRRQKAGRRIKRHLPKKSLEERTSREPLKANPESESSSTLPENFMKVNPSSHVIPLILKSLIGFTLTDSRKMIWFKKDLRFRKQSKINSFDRLTSLYDTWLSKAFPISQSSASTESKSDANYRTWTKILGVDLGEFSPLKFNPTPNSAKVTSHCFDQFIKAFSSIDIEFSRLSASLKNESSHSSKSPSSIKASSTLSKCLSILKDMEERGLKPSISTWNLILSLVAQEGRNLIFTDMTEEERESLRDRNSQGNGLGWKRTLELAGEMGIAKKTSKVKDQNNSLPRANLISYSSLMQSLIRIPPWKGGPMLQEAKEIRDLMFQVAKRNSARNSPLEKLRDSMQEGEMENRRSSQPLQNSSSQVKFTLEDIESNPIITAVLKKLEELEKKMEEWNRNREEQEEMNKMVREGERKGDDEQGEWEAAGEEQEWEKDRSKLA